MVPTSRLRRGGHAVDCEANTVPPPSSSFHHQIKLRREPGVSHSQLSVNLNAYIDHHSIHMPFHVRKRSQPLPIYDAEKPEHHTANWCKQATRAIMSKSTNENVGIHNSSILRSPFIIASLLLPREKPRASLVTRQRFVLQARYGRDGSFTSTSSKRLRNPGSRSTE
jgi:hypothetical protein